MRNVARLLAAWLLAAMSSGMAVAANQAPTATLTSPSPGTILYAPATIELTATAQDPDGTINKVEFLNGSTVIPGSADTSNPYSFTWTNVGPGTYYLKARATDNGSPTKTGDSAVVQVTVVQLTTTILSPAADSIVSGRSVNVTGHFIGPATTSIIVTSSAGHSAVASITGDTYTAQGVELRPGANVIDVAVARRDGTAETTSINVTAVEPPVVVVTGPQACTQPAPATVTLTAEALSPQGQIGSVQFLVDGAPVGTASAAPYSVSTTLSSVKTYAITAIATDQYGSAQSVRPLYLAVQAPPPTATITSPSNGASYRVGTPIPLAATASDATGTVSSVQFFRGGSMPIGNPVITPPYALDWTDAPLGVHSITAVATNNLGVKGTSHPVNVSVAQNSAPFVSITAPVNGMAYNAPADVIIEASASDDGSVAEVEFFAGTQSLGKKTTPPYAVTWANAPVGTHSLMARAKDNEDAVTTSAAVGITVDGVTAAITAPANGATFAAPASFMLSATAATSSGTVTKVELFDGTNLLETFTTNGTTVDLNVGMSEVIPGSHAYTIKATDTGGRTATSPAVIVTVTGPPTVSLTVPSNGSTFTVPAIINLSADASATMGTITKVEFFEGTNLIATASSPPYQATWNNVAAGNYTLTAKVTDSLGGTGTSAPASVTVLGLSVAIASPLNGASISGDGILVTGTFQAPGNSGIAVNGYAATLWGDRFYIQVPITSGTNILTATVTNQQGQNASTSVTVSADGVPPIVQITSSEVHGLAPHVVSYTVSNGSSNPVNVTLDGSSVGPAVAPGQSFTFDVTHTIPGAYPTTVSATDFQSVATTKQFGVVALDPMALDAMLKGLWTGMGAALSGGDKPAAMSYLDGSAKAKFGPVFDALLPQMAQIVGSFSTLERVDLSAESGEYVVRRLQQGINKLFFICFSRGADGVWRIQSM